MRYLRLLLPFALLMINGCGGNEERIGKEDAGSVAGSTTNGPRVPDRDEWQKPEQLMNLMGEKLLGGTVADLFADDGYFTFKMIDAGGRVIAIVDDPAKAEALMEEKKKRNLSDERLVIRTVAPGEPGLMPEEADAALIAHAYGRISDPQEYFTKLRQGLRDPRTVYILEWQNRATPVGPPLSERIPMEKLMDELSRSGFDGVGARGDKIPYQVIYMATEDVPM